MSEPDTIPCGNPECTNRIPNRLAGTGIAMSRKDNATRICSACGHREAMLDYEEALTRRAEASGEVHERIRRALDDEFT